MNTNINNKGGRRFAPWKALLVLSLLAAMVLAAPAVLFAQITGQLIQECDFALIGNDHTITATVTQGGVPGASDPVLFWSTDPSGVYFEAIYNFEEHPDGIVPFVYHADSVGAVEITLYWVKQDGTFEWVPLSTITTTWTDNEADLCSDPPGVTVGGQVTLDATDKNGALKIALCSVDGLKVENVDLKTVQLAGVSPWQSKYKDSKLCPDGKDGVKDLVFKFKTRELVEALEDSAGRKLEDGESVPLILTGSLKDKTPLDGTWNAMIKKEGKMHWKKDHHQKEDKTNKGKGPKK